MVVKTFSRGTVIGVGILFFIIFAISAGIMCKFRADNSAQAVIRKQQDMEQSLMDKTLDAIQVWREEIVNQARSVSSSEMFRLFMSDANRLTGDDIRRLSMPESLHSDSGEIRLLAEQRSYLQDLLKDLCRRRNWNDARILSVSGKELVGQEFSEALDESRLALTVKAMETGQTVFGPFRKTQDGIVLDMADPLFTLDVNTNQKCVATLFLTIPVDKILTNFLARNRDMQDITKTCILDRKSNDLARIANGHLEITRLDNPEKFMEFMPFALRQELDGKGKVYSLGQSPHMLDWLVIMETSASYVDDIIDGHKAEIYGVGLLGSIVFALFATVVWALISGNSHKKRALILEGLNHTIQCQKLLLDSVNSSLKIGLLLVDDKGFVRLSNPAFNELCNCNDKDMAGLPVVEVLPRSARMPLLTAIASTIENSQSQAIEVNIEGNDSEFLYRVTLYPYTALPGENISSGTGCVATFQDITEFRKKALQSAKIRDTLIDALEKAVESVDMHLPGHSAKVSTLARIMAETLQMQEWEVSTLTIAARLSQISKLFIPKDLLQKNGPLTEEDRNRIREAKEYADDILQNMDFDILPVTRTIMEMNERMDGSGVYGMKGDEISIYGRILSIANAYVAMTNPRTWRNGTGMNPEDAIRNMMDSGKFDMELMSFLEKNLKI